MEQFYLETYQKEYWTRVIAVQDYKVGSQERFSIGPDMVEEAEQLIKINADGLPDWWPSFDPANFQDQQKQYDLKDWVLS